MTFAMVALFGSVGGWLLECGAHSIDGQRGGIATSASRIRWPSAHLDAD
ncbi:MAG: hypothetical protein GX610_11350 [Rhodococcus sp.]|nr:hypothetical protein [Rhodococcus sp. (in: high G+C Gram-positive bacteria)]